VIFSKPRAELVVIARHRVVHFQGIPGNANGVLYSSPATVLSRGRFSAGAGGRDGALKGRRRIAQLYRMLSGRLSATGAIALAERSFLLRSTGVLCSAVARASRASRPCNLPMGETPMPLRPGQQFWQSPKRRRRYDFPARVARNELPWVSHNEATTLKELNSGRDSERAMQREANDFIQLYEPDAGRF
jgi:hypothetical protein